MGDRILLEALRIVGRHGALPEERERSQPFEVDLEIEADLEEAARRDAISATIDYGAVVREVVRIVEAESYELLEALAGRIAAAVLEQERAAGVSVTVRKLRPPVAADLSSAAVRITRRRA